MEMDQTQGPVRARKKGGDASSFYSFTAEHAVTQTIQANRAGITQWVRRGTPPKQDFSHRFSQPIEDVAHSNRTIETGRTAIVVLGLDGRQAAGYRLITAYVKP
jgi:hypothetical protein